MDSNRKIEWVEAASKTVASYRRMIDGIISQLSDAELRTRPRPDMNSVAVILRHLGGNLSSRWTDFMSTDGEKPDRNRDCEFTDWEGDTGSLLAYFNSGWEALTNAISQIKAENSDHPIYIRGERHTIADAVMRSLTHLSYHVGQIALIARMAHGGTWNWLTIAPGGSAQHNKQTWGATASRSIFGKVPSAKLQTVVFSPEHSFSVGELISNIQRKEFELPITLEQQPDLADIPGFYQTGKGNFWVAISENRVVGTISLLDIGNNQVALRKMFVHHDYRGSQFGTARNLLESAFEWCRSQGVGEIYLGTTAKFLAAHRFYEKNGFFEISKENLPERFPIMVVDTKFYMIKLDPL